jgi:alkylation response protein AidB-like acyl-CoA dehydrogenase
MKAQDTCELFFDNVKVPAQNLLGARRQRLHLPDAGTALGALQIA